jgi:outer membrane cobalamin receptor
MMELYTIKRLGMWLVLMLGTCGLWAQGVTIKGVVIDGTDDEPIGGVTVRVAHTSLGAVTAEDGSFALAVPRAASYDVVFHYPDWAEDSTVQLTDVPEQTVYQILYKKSSKTMMIDPVTVTATLHAENLSRLATSMDVMGQKSVDLQISSDIKEALQQNSGVDIIDGQPSIRGSSGYANGVGSRVMVMLDGLPLMSPDAGIAQFDMIPTDNIAQIEVMKGASSVLYGSSALGGVINVVMADAPAKPKTSVRLRGQMYDAPYDKTLDWDGDKSAKSAGVNVFHSQRVGTADVVGLVDFWHDTGYRYNCASTQGRAQLMTKFRPKNLLGVTMGVNSSIRFDSSSTFVFWDAYHATDTLRKFGTNDIVLNAGGALVGNATRRSQLNIRGTIDPFFKYLTPKGGLHSYRGRMMRTSNTNTTDQSNYNAMYYNDYNYSSRLLDDRMTMVVGGTLSYNTIRGDSIYSGKHKALNTAIYTQLDGKITSKLNATLGARYDRWLIDDSLVNASPIFRAGVNYELHEGTNVRASFGQAFRSPSIAERYLNTSTGGILINSNPELKVEKGYSAEVGIRQGFRAGTAKKGVIGYLDAAAFVMDYNNMIEFGVQTPDTFIFGATPAFAARNYSRARITGIEVTAMEQFTFKKLHFDLNGGITYMNPMNLNAGVDSMQVDLLNTVGPQSRPTTLAATGMLTALNSPADISFHRDDNPAVLKYRSKWLNRVSATVGYGRWSLTCNYRYKSAILAIDQFLYVGIPGAADWVLSHPKGYSIYDFIISSQVTKAFTVSMSAKNALNKEWAMLPGSLGEQRNFNMQMKYVF